MKTSIPFWIPYNGEIPNNAVVGGHYLNKKVYVGRAPHEGSLTPGMIMDNVLYLPWGCVSNRKENDFEILVCEIEAKWVAAHDGQIPLNAFPAGFSEFSHETLFIGRYKFENHLIVGKVQPSHRVTYIAHGPNELNNRFYEVLVI